MKSFGGELHFKVIFTSTLLFWSGIHAWNPDMPGGMKLVINGETFSFSTDVCSGGIFFKKPVHIELSCLHGYFLKRPNGCSMLKSSVIGGENYVCQRVNKDKTNLVQALIPVTNPEKPLDHTITFFDDPNTLKNLRRYTYVKGLEGLYEPSSSLSSPVGVIVSNTQKTPKVSIENVCYQGKALPTADAYVAMLQALGDPVPATSKIFEPGCDVRTVELPWNSKTVHNFTAGYSAPGLFETEKVADLSKKTSSDLNSESARHEIWNGLAYCLQANVQVSRNGGVVMAGIQPSIESLRLFCPKGSTNGKEAALRQRRKRRSLSRKTRQVQTSIEFNTLMTCVSTCWKENRDKCHEAAHQINRMPFCPPYCGGIKRPSRMRRSNDELV